MMKESETMAKQYQAQCARDAQEMNYGSESYWNYLEETAQEDFSKGVTDAFTRSLSEALRGNEGD
jgi:hypothetical protein